MKKKKVSAKKEKIVLPFLSTEFEQLWREWKEYRTTVHDLSYTNRGEQAALMPLQRYDELFASNLIITAIANNWRRFHFDNTLSNYANHKQQSNDSITDTNGEKYAPHVADAFHKYAKPAASRHAF